MKKMLTLAVLVAVVAVLSGCETVKGLGKDIQNTGDNIWEAINQND